MASPTVQMNVRVPPAIADAMKTRADAEEITLGAAVLEAFEAYLQSNGSDATSPEASARAATKGA